MNSNREATKARVILWGLGALGSQVVKALDESVSDIEIVGAVDHHPNMVDKTLAEVFGEWSDNTTHIHRDLVSCVNALDQSADVVYHMTESYVPKIESQLIQAMDLGLNVISASEGMFHPSLRFESIAKRLDDSAKSNNVSIVGCGINPGFSFDSLVLLLGRITTHVTSVTVRRVTDVTGTGLGDIDHVGFGFDPEDFEKKISTGRLVGHMGMPESIAAVAERFGIQINRIEESWKTQLNTDPVESGSERGVIEPGRVVGILQRGTGFLDQKEIINMHLNMFYEPTRYGHKEADEIILKGSHNIHASLTPSAVSIQGAGLMIVNATHDIIQAPDGLCNVLDLSIGGRRRGGFILAIDPDYPSKPKTTRLIQRPIA